jgi:WD40 repeat protein
MQRPTRPVGLTATVIIAALIATAILPAAAALPVGAQADGPGPYTQQGTLGRGLVRSVAWSPDGDTIAVGGALGIWLYTPDLADLGRLTGHTKAVYGLAFSPDSQQLLSVSHDMTVRIWDLATQTERFSLTGHTDLVVAAVWSPAGDLVASGAYDGTVRLWDPDSGREVRVLDGQGGWVNQVAFAGEGKQVVSHSFGGTPRADGAIRVWRTRDGALLAEHPGTPSAWALATGQPEDAFLGARLHPVARAFSPDGTREAVVDWNAGVQVFDTTNGTLAAEQPSHMDFIVQVNWDQDTVRAVTLDGRRLAWDAASGHLLAAGVVESAEVSAAAEGAESPAPVLHPDGTRQIHIDAGGIVRILDADGTVIAALPGRANAAAWSPDGAGLAVAVRNGTITLWSES